MSKLESQPAQSGMGTYRQEDDRKRELARIGTQQTQIDELRQALRELASRQLRVEETFKAYEGAVAQNRLLIDQIRQENHVTAQARAVDENRTRQQVADMDQRLDDAVRPIRSLQAHVSELLEASRRKTDDTAKYQRQFDELRTALDHLTAVGDRDTVAAHQLRDTIEAPRGELEQVRRDILRNEDAVKIVDQEMRRRIAEVAQAGESVHTRLDDLRSDISHALSLIDETQRSIVHVDPALEELIKGDAEIRQDVARFNQLAIERHEVIIDRLDDLRQSADSQFADVRQAHDQRLERLGERIEEAHELYREIGVKLSALTFQLDELRLGDETLRRELWQLHEQRVRPRLDQAQQELDQVTNQRRTPVETQASSRSAQPRPADR